MAVPEGINEDATSTCNIAVPSKVPSLAKEFSAYTPLLLIETLIPELEDTVNVTPGSFVISVVPKNTLKIPPASLSVVVNAPFSSAGSTWDSLVKKPVIENPLTNPYTETMSCALSTPSSNISHLTTFTPSAPGSSLSPNMKSVEALVCFTTYAVSA